MRYILEKFVAGHEVVLSDTVYESDGITPFNGSLYEVIGKGVDIADSETTVEFTGTINSVGALTATLTSATTLDLGGKTIRFDVFLKSGPFEFCVFSGFFTFTERVTP